LVSQPAGYLIETLEDSRHDLDLLGHRGVRALKLSVSATGPVTSGSRSRP